MYLFDVLVECVKSVYQFSRERVPLRVKVLATILYYSGLSLRDVESVIGYSRESVRKWFRIIGSILPKPELRERKLIAVDETKVKLCGRVIYVWAARDLESGEIVAVRATLRKRSQDALLVIKDALAVPTNRPHFIIDKGPWYSEIPKKLGLSFEEKSRGPRNMIESWFRKA